MATTLLGTTNNASLISLVFSGQLSPVDIGMISNDINNDKLVSPIQFPGAFAQTGLLYVPNRGVLKCLPGDVVGVDQITGWPILVSARALASGPWHNG